MADPFQEEANAWEMTSKATHHPQKIFKNLGRSASLAASIPVVVILCLTAFFVFQAERTSARTQSQQAKAKIISLNSQSLRLLVEMQTGLRGYLLTGKSEFLQPFSASVLLVPESLNRLSASLSAQPAMQLDVENIRFQYRIWLGIADHLRILRATHGDYTNLRLNLDEKNQMDLLRDQHRKIRETQINAMQAEQNEANQEAKKLLGLGIVMSLLFGLGLGYFFRRQFFRQLHQTVIVGQRADAILRQLKTITDVAPVAIVYVDRQERYLFANPHYREHFARGDIEGKSISDVVGEGYAELQPYVQRVLAGETVNFGIEVARGDRPPIFVESIYAPSIDENGEIQGFVAISEDVTERKAAEQQLKNSQENLFVALQSAQEREARNAFLLRSVSAFSKTLTPSEVLETCIDLCSEAFGSYSGALAVPNAARTQLFYVPRKKGAERVNIALEETGIPVDSDYATAVTFRTQKPYFVNSRAERTPLLPELPENTPISLVEGFASLPLISEGEPIGVLKIVFKNRKVISLDDQHAFVALGDLASQALERSQRYEKTKIERDQYRSFFDLSGSGASEVDATTYRFVRVNERFCEMTGYTEPELKQLTFMDITHPEDISKSTTGYQKLKENGLPHWRLEKRYLRKDGTTLWTIMSGTMIFDSAGNPLRSLATIFDITELKLAEEALKKALSARDQF
jgi:PAS domain S-box-containing protein